MRRAKILAAVIYGTLVMATMAFVHFPDLQASDAQEHAARARITAEQARDAALRAVPGAVKASELEREHGRLVYSLEIVRPGERRITEVNVSAMDGSIVNIHRERADRRNHGRQSALNAPPASAEQLL